MLKNKRFLKVCAIAAVALLLGLAVGPADITPTEAAPAPLGPATVIYNIYATDGYVTLADGTSIYIYGFVGGRQGVPFSYINSTGQLVTVPGGPPAPTPGPNTPAEQALAGCAQLPAPIIYCKTNDVVEIRLKNLGVTNPTAVANDPHSIHLHGVDVDAANDGVPETSVAVIAGGTSDPILMPLTPGAGNVVVYMFTAKNPGTYMYHCHQEASIHVQMGMYGALVVYNPTERQPTPALARAKVAISGAGNTIRTTSCCSAKWIPASMIPRQALDQTLTRWTTIPSTGW